MREQQKFEGLVLEDSPVSVADTLAMYQHAVDARQVLQPEFLWFVDIADLRSDAATSMWRVFSGESVRDLGLSKSAYALIHARGLSATEQALRTDLDNLARWLRDAVATGAVTHADAVPATALVGNSIDAELERALRHQLALRGESVVVGDGVAVQAGVSGSGDDLGDMLDQPSMGTLEARDLILRVARGDSLLLHAGDSVLARGQSWRVIQRHDARRGPVIVRARGSEHVATLDDGGILPGVRRDAVVQMGNLAVPKTWIETMPHFAPKRGAALTLGGGRYRVNQLERRGDTVEIDLVAFT